MLEPDTLVHTRYRIVRLIGQGGMGAVYEARDEVLKRRVALKQMLVIGDRFTQAFMREAQLLANLEHRALPNVIDHFRDPAGQFLVMQYIPGDDLAKMLVRRGGPFPVEQVLAWTDQLLDVLHYLHTQETPILHRDIKPLNLKLRADDSIVLLDFGLAKGASGEMTRVTSGGSLIGHTPGYAPIEQLDGTGTDARSDLYALGATVYYLMTNEVPIDSLARLKVARRGADPLRPAHEVNSQVPIGISKVLEQLLELDAADRPASVVELRQALQAARLAPQSAPHDQRAVQLVPPPSTMSTGEVREPPLPPSEQEITEIEPIDLPQGEAAHTPMAKPLQAPPSAPSLPARRGKTRLWAVIGIAVVAVLLSAGVLSNRFRSAPSTGGAAGTNTAVPTLRPTNTASGQQRGTLVPTAPGSAQSQVASVATTATLPTNTIAPPTVQATATSTTPPPSPTTPPYPFVLAGHTGFVMGVAFAPDGQTLASGSVDNTIRLWLARDGSPLRTLEGHTDLVYTVAFAPDGQTLASGAGDNAVRLWRVSDGSLLRTLEGHSSAVRSVAFAPDGETLATGAGDNAVKLWRLSDGRLLRTLEGHTGSVQSIAFAPDGQTLASGAGDNTVRLWRVSNGRLLRTFEGHTNFVDGVAFAPDGLTLASGGGDNTVRQWRVRDGRLLRTLEGHTSYVDSVAFAPDGLTLASGGGDGTVKLWRVRDGSLLRTLEGNTGSVQSVAFAPDGQTLASGSADNTVRLWQVNQP